jgi:FSR family fosmidomycin resistance protein-like MFS transporter
MKSPSSPSARVVRRLTAFALILLVIEFLDEFVFGLEQAAWPLIRDDLQLTYWQLGLLFAVPRVFGSAVEPLLGVLADTRWRRMLVLGGGVGFALACTLTGLAPQFGVLLLSMMLFSPSSGAFVSLSQATLMDTDPARHEQLMARWTFAGSAGVVAGPLLLGAAALLGFGWREPYIFFGVLALALTLCLARRPFPATAATPHESLTAGFRAAFRALARRDVLRWLILLEFSDFMLDILLGFLALYIVDVAGGTPEQGALAVGVWTGVGLLGDFLLIPLLERVRGLSYLRFSAAVILVLFPAFLLVPSFPLKLVCLGLMGLFNAGWYAILKGNMYSALPGQSGTVIAVDALFGIATGFIPGALGWVAEQSDLNVTMWLLLLGPAALVVGLPRATSPAAGETPLTSKTDVL